ncbi:glycogen debranching enzyme [Micromonospora pisi]|uniref:Glycogen debranching enzyme n=1 Tax=Micromonospora pisi TaxID=589240 RepID=A0A495JS42_9ACTN|nr:glycogen debranching N-terminal domain-containing protein [Micromonospora pisi]RKR91820.1 glycogen debranching enzyme [Micromonospora pisi]
MNSDVVRILDGNMFVVSAGNGDFEPSPSFPTGLFTLDIRHLSTWVLTVDGKRLSALSMDQPRYFEAKFVLVPGEPTLYVDSDVSIIRRRDITRSMCESLTVLNHGIDPVDLVVRVEVGCDFADLFEVKNAEPKKGERSTRIEDGRLCHHVRWDTFQRSTVISASTPAEIDEHGFTFRVHVEPDGSWGTDLHVETIGPNGRDVRTNLQGQAGRSKPQVRNELQDWLDLAPQLISENDLLELTYQRSLVDLAALRFRPLTSGAARAQADDQYRLPAAGLPWFMTIFGRDSILTSLQALPFAPQLANATLRLLAATQAVALDNFRDAEPGKILHEFRYGLTAASGEQPHTPYYGTADATTLFVVLLDEYARWTGDTALVQNLEHQTRAALAWIDEYGDVLGNGYIGYQRRNERTGLENQCWKDSPDAISYRDGRIPDVPRSTCELQGYAYDAKLRGARLARTVWDDPAYADRLERSADELKRRFNRDFWVADGSYFAIALAADGSQVDALSSNIGHLLWSGIVDADKADAVAGHLMGPRLFSGWGIRTLAEHEARYNPIGYHTGTVWPFDNSFIAWGLRRYGYRQEAARVGAGILDAANFFRGRLPEAFAGYDRQLTGYPVEYPTACSPQAWSTGAPLLLLRVMLGLQPQDGDLAVDPELPSEFGRLELRNLPGSWGRKDLTFEVG